MSTKVWLQDGVRVWVNKSKGLYPGLVNIYGCDSLVTLDLTINSTSGTDIRTECNSLTWINGITYTSNNNTATFNIVGGNSNSCDSLVTLDLTIINSSIGTDTRSACNSLTWINGNTYTSNNNTATHNIVCGATNCCDSLVTLNLTISNIDANYTFTDKQVCMYNLKCDCQRFSNRNDLS